MNKNIYGNSILLLTAFIWGSTFVAQISGMNYIGPFTFSASRCFLSTICLAIISFFMRKNNNNNFKKMDLVKGGALCGIFLFMGSSLQQIALVYTTAGKASFITSLYILIIPFFSMFLYKNKIHLITWIAVILGLIGLFLLAIPNFNNFMMNKGDFIVLIGSFFWGGHILLIDNFSKKTNVVHLSLTQFFITTILATICSFLFESDTANFRNIIFSWHAIMYAGVLSGGIAYTLQMVGQKYTNPILASLILSLESVFGALSGYLFLNEILSQKEFLGCIIVFIAIIIAQIPHDFKFKK